MSEQKNELPCCPQCFRNSNVRPLSVGLVGGYPQTVDYECSACGRVFKPVIGRGIGPIVTPDHS
jgi:hypothetical protein